MAKSPQARNIANMRYRSKAYDRVSFDVKQGMREEYKQAAAERNIGLAELFRRGADEFIANHPVDKREEG